MSINTLGPIQGQFKGTTDVVSLTLDTTLLAADLGKIFLLDATGEAITIPAATGLPNGATYQFIVGTTVASTNWTVVSAADDMIGVLQVSDDADVGPSASSTPVDTITFVAAGSICVPGNQVTLQVIGASWHVTGVCSVAEAITLTT